MDNEEITLEEIETFVKILPKFTFCQLKEIYNGIKRNINPLIYANPKFSTEEMSSIAFEFFHNPCQLNDASKKYAKFDFDYHQIKQILQGIKENIDVSIYADKNICAKNMEYIRNKIRGNRWFNYERFEKEYKDVNFSIFQKVEILLGFNDHVDVNIYANIKYDHKQMEMIRIGLVYNKINYEEDEQIDVSIYCNYEFSFCQMKEIYCGLVKNLDVSVYAKKDYTAQQMREIYYGLVDNLDISVYAKKDYTAEQMKQIRLGLLENIDVSYFAKPDINADAMESFREGLKKLKKEAKDGQ